MGNFINYQTAVKEMRVHFISRSNECLLSPAKELYSACNPVVSKPKPKVELPKDEKTENGPVNGHQGTENQSPNPDKTTSAGMEQETVEPKLPEMDID